VNATKEQTHENKHKQTGKCMRKQVNASEIKKMQPTPNKNNSEPNARESKQLQAQAQARN